MGERFLECYVFVSILIALIDVLLCIKSLQKRNMTGKFLGYACAGAAVVDVSYLISILNNSYLCMSVMSSVYFVSIDIMLVCLLVFTICFTKQKFTARARAGLISACAYTLFEVVVFAINPFREIAVHYVPRSALVAQYSYEMKPLYWMHLGFTYFLVAAILFLLIWKMYKIPREYRAQYHFIVIGILAIVSVNAVFLFCKGGSIFSLLDYSICGYSLTAFLLYWCCFNYSTHGMLNRLKTSIFENIDQGIVLFDYDDTLILHNARADELLGEAAPRESMSLEDFQNSCNLPLNEEGGTESFSLQCYVNSGEEQKPLRCDIRQLKNDKQQVLGKLFVFSDAALETDLLTSFQNWESFQRFVREKNENFLPPVAVAVCDINSLSVINSTMGNHYGDKKIRGLAEAMRECFPKQTYFVRGIEANLIALCSHTGEEAVQGCLESVKHTFDGHVQYAVSTAAEENPDILHAISEATAAMRAKKLLDKESIHSEMLTSLIRALQECDRDTEHHVRRTQYMGAELGKRIGLNDIQQSQLSLLCLLHDIGKIGIPLEILNKPGKLTDEEWNILKSHTEKGYAIANSNNELKAIAEEIRHHHERWDGAGYPDGLSCESIPLLSRIIAVVDTYDAMTNDRSYRAATSHEKAVEELKRCAGSQFDPFIVAEFLQMLKENPSAVPDHARRPEAEQQQSRRTEEGTADSKNNEGNSVHSVCYSRYVLDENMKIIFADENFEQLTGYTQEDLQTAPLFQMDLIPEEDQTEYLCLTNASLARNSMAFQEHKLLRKDGSAVYVLCMGRVYFDSAAREARSEIVISDITGTYAMKMLADEEQSKAQARLRYWERTYRRDSLTGLLNHAAFRSDVELKILEGRTNIMMIMMDVDRFKEFNDTYGHQRGDKYLIVVAQALLTALRKEDRACRMGGDEFAAILFFALDVSEELMRERARQIFDKVNMTVQATEGGTGISMGAFITGPDTSFNAMYEKSDRALYEAKRKGRGRLAFYTEAPEKEEPEKEEPETAEETPGGAAR